MCTVQNHTYRKNSHTHKIRIILKKKTKNLIVSYMRNWIPGRMFFCEITNLLKGYGWIIITEFLEDRDQKEIFSVLLLNGYKVKLKNIIMFKHLIESILDLFILFCVYGCFVFMCARHVGCPWRSEEVIEALGARVKQMVMVWCVGVGNQNQDLCKHCKSS